MKTANALPRRQRPQRLIERFTPPTCTLELWTERTAWPWQSLTLPEYYTFTFHFDDPRLPEDQQVTLKGDRLQLEQLMEVVNSYVQNFLEQSCRQSGEVCAGSTPASANTVTLIPLGLLRHQLSFGTWDSSAPQVLLSSSQLVDVMTALDRYDRFVVLATPSAQPIAKAESSPRSFWVWSSLAVMGLGVIGLLGIFLRSLQPQTDPLAVNPSPLPARTKFSFVEVLPPIPPAPTLKTLPNPNLAAPLALRDPLPPPAPTQPAIAPPRNPTVNLVIPPAKVLPPVPGAPPAPPAQTIVLPPPQNLSPTAAPPANAPYPPPLAFAPNNLAPSLPILPPTTGSVPQFQGRTLPPQPALPPLAATSTGAINPPPGNLTPLEAPPVKETNLLDTIPQVGEVRDYFQRQWQPPDGLAQTLEYRLLIKPDGSLNQTIPLGKAASVYLAQVPMPSPGQPFVSPLKIPGSEDQTVRLVLSPNGTVKTFLE